MRKINIVYIIALLFMALSVDVNNYIASKGICLPQYTGCIPNLNPSSVTLTISSTHTGTMPSNMDSVTIRKLVLEAGHGVVFPIPFNYNGQYLEIEGNSPCVAEMDVNFIEMKPFSSFNCQNTYWELNNSIGSVVLVYNTNSNLNNLIVSADQDVNLRHSIAGTTGKIGRLVANCVKLYVLGENGHILPSVTTTATEVQIGCLSCSYVGDSGFRSMSQLTAPNVEILNIKYVRGLQVSSDTKPKIFEGRFLDCETYKSLSRVNFELLEKWVHYSVDSEQCKIMESIPPNLKDMNLIRGTLSTEEPYKFDVSGHNACLNYINIVNMGLDISLVDLMARRCNSSAYVAIERSSVHGFLPDPFDYTNNVFFPPKLLLNYNKLTGKIPDNYYYSTFEIQVKGNFFHCPFPAWLVRRPNIETTGCQVACEDCVHGKCVQQFDMNFCECDDGFSGKFCEINTVNDCSANVCVNGFCIDIGSKAECVCDDGFEGSNCDISISANVTTVEKIPFAWVVMVPYTTVVGVSALSYVLVRRFSNKDADPASIVILIWSIFDIVVDVLFLTTVPLVLLIAGIITLFLSTVANVGVVFWFLKRRWNAGDEMNEWIRRHIVVVILVSLLSCFQVSNYRILSSKMFGMKFLDWPVSSGARRSLDLTDFVRLCMEDIPMVVIQGFSLWYSEVNVLTVLALVATSTSIMILLVQRLVLVFYRKERNVEVNENSSFALSTMSVFY